MSDGYGVYRDYDWRLRCLAHLIRKARGLEQSLEGQAHRFGQKTLEVLETLMAAVYKAREGPPPDVSLRQQHAALLRQFLDLCDRHWDARHEKTRALAREFINDWDAIWAILDYPLLPLTNNIAEQALRHWVIARRISFGTRTPQGSMAFSLLASVIETCRQRGITPWPYIAEVIKLRRSGEPAPLGLVFRRDPPAPSPTRFRKIQRNRDHHQQTARCMVNNGGGLRTCGATSRCCATSARPPAVFRGATARSLMPG